jgi:Ankyrin repeats (3 copies)
MADYYPLIRRAISNLTENTEMARNLIYERARSTLLTQLARHIPRMSTSEVTRERQYLEEAIRKVEEEVHTALGPAPVAVGPPPPPLSHQCPYHGVDTVAHGGTRWCPVCASSIALPAAEDDNPRVRDDSAYDYWEMRQSRARQDRGAAVMPNGSAQAAKSAYGDSIRRADRVGAIVLSAAHFVVPIIGFFALFGPWLAARDGRPLIFAFVNLDDRTTRIGVSIVLFAILSAAWKQAWDYFLVAFKKKPTVLHRATESGDLKSVAAALATSKIDARDRYGNTPLHVAAFKGNLSSASAVLAAGADVNARQKNGNSALHLDAYNGHKEMVELLLANKADVNSREDNFATPLHIAALKGYKVVVELLLASGAEAAAKDNDGRTPVDVARVKGHQEIAELLHRREAGVE